MEGHMAQILINDATFARLQRLAVPLVDTMDSLIEKMADAYEGKSSLAQPNGNSKPAQSASQNGVTPLQFEGATPPNLTHAKILSARLDGKELRNPTWNGMLSEAVTLAKARARTDDELRRLILVNFVKGKKEDEGYHFLPAIGLSVQGQDANLAWNGAHHIAKQLGIAIEAEFVWRVKDGAAFPGVTGRLSA
jgi:hypothetical protein